MGKPLRVLIVEDSEDDALLILQELKKGGYDPVYRRVETAQGMDEALTEKWDVVISDYRMPEFSAPAALKLLQEKGIDIPFIVVSGTIGEDVAVEMMKAGVQDYVMKNNLKRLAVDIERELRDAGHRKERKISEGKVLHLNRVLRAIRGVNQLITREKDRGKLLSGACRHLVKDGGYKHVLISIFDGEGKVILFADEETERRHPRIRTEVGSGRRLKCQEIASGTDGPAVIADVSSACAGCPMTQEHAEKSALCCQLACGGRTLGTIVALLPEALALDKEEQGLFKELAGDLSYALAVFESEKTKEIMSQERDKHLQDLEIYYRASMGREERILELKKEIARLKKGPEKKR